MINVGTKLGGKYFVVAKQDRVTPGAFFEVRDARAQVFWVQWLSDAPLNEAQMAQLRQEIAALPVAPSLVLPDDLVSTESGLAAALFNSAPPKPLSSLLPGLAVGGQEPRRIAALQCLVRWVTALAEDTQRIHNARATHGAISIDHVFVIGEGDTARPLLGGFGLENAARAAKSGVRPAPRADLAALVTILQVLMDRVGAKFTGGTLVKWDVLRNCARAGDHPALVSATALAQALRQLLDDEEATHRAKNATPKNAPSGAPVPASPSPSPPALRRRTLWIAVGGAVLVGGVALAAALLNGGLSAGGPGGVFSRTARSIPARCGDEPLASPVTVDLPTEASSLIVGCRGDQTLSLLARSGESLLAMERPAQRGRAYAGAAVTLADEVGRSLARLDTPSGAWVAWRNARGVPFGVAELGGAAQPRALSMPGWDAAAVRGVWLLRVEGGAVWLATNLLRDGETVPLVLQISTAGAPSAFRVGEGEILAAIGGQPATLLLREGAALRARTVATNALAVLATGDADAGALTLRTVPSSALPASEPWSAPGRWVLAAPAGVAVQGGARHFAVTTGDQALPEGCEGVGCAVGGEARVLSFAERGPPAVRAVASNARATSVALDANGGMVVSGVDVASGRGAFWLLPSDAQPSRFLLPRDQAQVSAARCGDEVWVVAATTRPRPGVFALPLPCAVLRADH